MVKFESPMLRPDSPRLALDDVESENGEDNLQLKQAGKESYGGSWEEGEEEVDGNNNSDGVN